MNRCEDTLDAYLAAWNCEHAPARRRHLLRACAPEVEHIDLAGTLHGVDAVDAHIARVRAFWPGARWHVQETPLCAGQRALLRWVWVCGTQVIASGHSILRLDAQNRVTHASVRLEPRVSGREGPGLSLWGGREMRRGAALAPAGLTPDARR